MGDDVAVGAANVVDPVGALVPGLEAVAKSLLAALYAAPCSAPFCPLVEPVPGALVLLVALVLGAPLAVGVPLCGFVAGGGGGVVVGFVVTGVAICIAPSVEIWSARSRRGRRCIYLVITSTRSPTVDATELGHHPTSTPFP